LVAIVSFYRPDLIVAAHPKKNRFNLQVKTVIL
jgi:hypothetical protein